LSELLRFGKNYAKKREGQIIDAEDAEIEEKSSKAKQGSK